MRRELGFSAGARLVPAPGTAGAPAMWVVGATAIALAVSMVIQNAMFVATDAPGYGDPTEEVFAWHRQNRTVVAIAVAQEALHIPLLLGFLTGLHGLVAGRGGAAWSRLAMAAGATLSAVFALYSVLWVGVVLSVGEHAEPNPTFELAWLLHAAAFALALPVLGATFIGAALAAHLSRLTPSWRRVLGVVGEACCSPPGRPASRSRMARRSCLSGCPDSPSGSSGYWRPACASCALEQPTALTPRQSPERLADNLMPASA